MCFALAMKSFGTYHVMNCHCSSNRHESRNKSLSQTQEQKVRISGFTQLYAR